MTLWFYPKQKGHTSSDTDKLILESLRRYSDLHGKTTALPVSSVRVLRTENGKPYLESGFPALGVTHSDSVVIIALHDTPFGIDCEDIGRRIPHLDALCKRFFSKAEQAFVENGPESEKEHRFLEVWVKKEAYVKYTGDGLQSLSDTDTTALPGHFENRSDEKHILYLYYP